MEALNALGEYPAIENHAWAEAREERQVSYGKHQQGTQRPADNSVCRQRRQAAVDPAGQGVRRRRPKRCASRWNAWRRRSTTAQPWTRKPANGWQTVTTSYTTGWQRLNSSPRAIRTTLKAFVESYIDGRVDVKPLTKTKYRSTLRTLTAFFGADKRLRDITPGDAEDWRRNFIKKEHCREHDPQVHGRGQAVLRGGGQEAPDPRQSVLAPEGHDPAQPRAVLLRHAGGNREGHCGLPG